MGVESVDVLGFTIGQCPGAVEECQVEAKTKKFC